MNLYDKTLHCKNIKHHEHDEILNQELIKFLIHLQKLHNFKS